MKSPHPILMIAVWLAVVAFSGVILYQNLELRSESKRLQHEVHSQSVLKLSEEIQLAKRFTPETTLPGAINTAAASPEIKPPKIRKTASRNVETQLGAPTVEDVFATVPDIETAQTNFRKIPLYDPNSSGSKLKTPSKPKQPSITVRPTLSGNGASEPPVGKISGFTDGGGVFGTSEKPATGSDIAIAGCLVIDINKAGDGTLGINRGTDAGISNGMKMFIIRDEEPVGMIEIINAGPYVSIGEIIDGEQRINVNDRCILGK